MTIGDKSYEIVAPAVVKVPPHIQHGLHGHRHRDPVEAQCPFAAKDPGAKKRMR